MSPKGTCLTDASISVIDYLFKAMLKFPIPSNLSLSKIIQNDPVIIEIAIYLLLFLVLLIVNKHFHLDWVVVFFDIFSKPILDIY